MSKVYDIITSQIIAQLEKGIIPWKKSWSTGGLPKNGISGKDYNAINPFLLLVKGYNNPNWFTFKQIQEAGGNVRKGEKATMVIFWKKFTPTQTCNDDEEVTEHLVLRYYNVFNCEQTEGLNSDKYALKTHTNNPIKAADKIVTGYKIHGGPKIEYHEQRAYYRPSQDIINMPKFNTFVDAISFYQTLFHEMIHSTGHESRLNRLSKDAHFGSQDYSKEELIAEMGASFLSGHAGIFNNEQLEQAGAYIQGWLKALKNDKMMVIKAAAQAQKAADYIGGDL